MFETLIIASLAVVSVLGCPANDTGVGQRPGLGWPKDFFPIMPWDKLGGWRSPVMDAEAALRSIAACNFTLSAYASPKDLPVIEKLGLKAVLFPPTDEQPWKNKWRTISPGDIEKSVERWIASCQNSSAVAAFYVWDEPGTPEFPGLAAAVDAIRKHAPGKLAYINLFPCYATIGAPDQSQLGAATYEEYLERFIEEVKPEVLSYDDYMVQYSDDFRDDAKAAIYFRDLLTVRQIALKHNIPFWNTVASSQIRPGFTIPSPANLLVQAYTTLAAGGKGLCWYTYFQGGYAYAPIDNSGRRTQTWHYLRMVNGQVRTLGPIMNRLTSTGVFFSRPWPDSDVPMLPGRIVESVTARSSLSDAKAPEPVLMVGEFTGEDGVDYAMVVNLSLERSANFVLKTRKQYARKEVFSASDGSLSPLDEENGHWLVAGAGVLIKLTNP